MTEVEHPSPDTPSATQTAQNHCSKTKKLTKPPPITPRRFKKFFTPVSTSSAKQGVRTSRRALQRITNPSGDRRDPGHDSKTRDRPKDLECATQGPSGVRLGKRKLALVFDENSAQSPPWGPEPFFLPSSQENSENKISSGKHLSESTLPCPPPNDDENDEPHPEDLASFVHRQRHAVRRLYSGSRSGNILANRISGPRKRNQQISGTGWQDETTSFYSTAQDSYFCGIQEYGHPVLPFCSASCNTNSLVAIGDEDGGIRLLEPASKSQPGFSKAYLTFKSHDNAIMDLDFSEDDVYLATGSGDQTCQIIDMVTQQTLHVLSGHCSSIKRVHFQPGSRNSILASCSRDGNVNIWDLRARSHHGPVHQVHCTLEDVVEEQAPPIKFNWPALLMRDTIRGAHVDGIRNGKSAMGKPRPSHRREEASVTSLVFLGSGREHLLATSSEADATVKLWDMRMTYDTRRSRPSPLSTTRQPESHEIHRRFGLTSMALSSDSARLFTLCRDHTIYAYSTSHLILGNAPELNATSARPRRAGGCERRGLGPIYGMRHRQLEASTFYVKLSVRQPHDGRTEMLAAGSGNDCAVLFPTDERDLPHKAPSASRLDQRQSPLQGFDTGSNGVSGSEGNSIPIYQHGTALIQGHRKEVTASSWTSEGQLITVSDDFHVRCWRQGDEARNLRMAGEGQGRRWMCGWADVDASYDDTE